MSAASCLWTATVSRYETSCYIIPKQGRARVFWDIALLSLLIDRALLLLAGDPNVLRTPSSGKAAAGRVGRNLKYGLRPF